MYGWKRLEIIVSNICIILLDNRFTSSEHLLSLVNVDRSSLPRCSLKVIYTFQIYVYTIIWDINYILSNLWIND